MKDRNIAATSAQNTRRMAGTDSGPIRRTPDREHAAGMLAAIKRGHVCTEACTSTVTLGDGKRMTLTCPYERLDLDSGVDRRIIGSIYAIEAKAAMGASS